ncbi:MAG: hypothetical protein RJA44_1923, partial [Pseudomonadota bacterium]
QAVDTEKRGGRVLKFDGKPAGAPAQATDSARQRGDAGGQGEPGIRKPRIDGGRLAPPDASTDSRDQLLTPLPELPAWSGATGPGQP